MVSVYLVDDDPLVLKSLEILLKRIDIGIEVCGNAQNGIEALREIPLRHPDIIITDIKMPKMDGIQLIEKLNEKRIPPKVIVLSAYREFELAQKAMARGACGYLLKPITEEKASNTLGSVIDMINSEKRAKKKIQMMREALRESESDIRHNFLRHLLRRRIGLDDFVQKTRQLELNFLSERCRIASIKCSPAEEVQNKEAEKLSSGKALLDLLGTELKERGTVFFNSDAQTVSEEIVVIIQSKPRDADTKLLQRLIDKARDVDGYSVRLGSSKPFTGGRFLDAYEESKFARRYTEFTDGPELCEYQKIEYIKNYLDVRFADDAEHLIQKLESGDGEEAIAIVDSLIFKLGDNRKLNPDDTYKAIHEVIVLIKNACQRLRISEESIKLLSSVGIRELEAYPTVKDLQHFLHDLVRRLIADLERLRTKDDEKRLEKVRKYCEEHIAEDISLDTISGYIYFNKNYFSSFFRCKTGETFCSYLVGLRLAKAKKLLTDTEMKVSQIARLVGYRNASHFGKVFKRNAGTTPVAFRNNFK